MRERGGVRGRKRVLQKSSREFEGETRKVRDLILLLPPSIALGFSPRFSPVFAHTSALGVAATRRTGPERNEREERDPREKIVVRVYKCEVKSSRMHTVFRDGARMQNGLSAKCHGNRANAAQRSRAADREPAFALARCAALRSRGDDGCSPRPI